MAIGFPVDEGIDSPISVLGRLVAAQGEAVDFQKAATQPYAGIKENGQSYI